MIFAALGVVTSRFFIALAARGKSFSSRSPVFNKREAFNPFYLLVVLAGVAFVVTACAQAATDLKQLRPGAPAESPAAIALIAWLQAHGTRALAIELAVL